MATNSLTRRHDPKTLIQDISDKINYNLPLTGQKIWSNTEEEGLAVIGCEPGNFTPSETLYNIDMPSFLNLLKAEFDFILIEGSALNDFADSQELSAYADAVFTVFSADHAVSHADDDAIKFISLLGAKNKGAILNNVLKENVNF